MVNVRLTTACGTFHEAVAEAEETVATKGRTIQMLLVVRHSEVVRIFQRNRAYLHRWIMQMIRNLLQS